MPCPFMLRGSGIRSALLLSSLPAFDVVAAAQGVARRGMEHVDLGELQLPIDIGRIHRLEQPLHISQLPSPQKERPFRTISIRSSRVVSLIRTLFMLPPCRIIDVH